MKIYGLATEAPADDRPRKDNLPDTSPNITISRTDFNHDFVIIDGPPILASDAAAMLVPHADTVILATRSFFSHSRLVRQALDMLYQRWAKAVNIVMKRAHPDDLAGHQAMRGFYPARRGPQGQRTASSG